MKIITTVMSSTEAAEMLCLGGLTWVMYPGDDFSAHDFMEWTGYMPTFEEIVQMDEMAAALEPGQAISVDLV